jgi:hypothetical protein
MVSRSAGFLRAALFVVGVAQQAVGLDTIGLLVGTLGVRLCGTLDRGLYGCG